MSQDQYNWVYKQLVSSPNDVVGALAYVLYKQQKISYLDQFHREHGRAPTDDELSSFHMISTLPDSVASYQERAETWVDEFLELALASKLRQAEEDIKAAVTIGEIKGVKSDLTAAVGAFQQVLEGKMALLQKELESRKGASGWAKDIVSNFIVNVLTVVVVGLAMLGLGAFDAITSKAKHQVQEVGLHGVDKLSSSQPGADGKPSGE